MTTEPKAEGGEAVGEVYVHVVPEDWGRHPEMRSARVKFYGDAPPAGTKLYTHPSPSAVEALARAADAIAERISYYAELGEHASTNIEDWAYTDGSGDIARLRAALAHPEIAALLKGEKK